MTTLKVTMCHRLAKHALDDNVVAHYLPSNGNKLIERCQTDHCISLNDLINICLGFSITNYNKKLYPLTFYLFPKGQA